MHQTNDTATSAQPPVPAIGRGTPTRRLTDASARLRRFPAVEVNLPTIVIDREVSDFTIDEIDEASKGEALTLLGDPRHFRVEGSAHQAFGYFEYCGLEEGLCVTYCEATYMVPLALPIVAENMIRVRIASDGDGEYWMAHGELLDLKGPSASIIIEPPGQQPAETVCAGHLLAAEVYIHRDFLTRLYAREDRELPAVVRAFISGDLRQTVARRLPLSPQLLRMLEDLKICPLEGRGRRLVFRSKAIEILCHAFDALAHEENCNIIPEASRLAANGVVKAQQLLSTNFVDPPSLDDLAQEVGMSRSGLCSAFRQIVGQSVFDHIAELRMQQALAMLTRHDATIAEVAYAVGYSHPSSFSVAFQRYFGTTASEARRRK